MKHYLLVCANSDGYGEPVWMQMFVCFFAFCMQQVSQTHMHGSHTLNIYTMRINGTNTDLQLKHTSIFKNVHQIFEY